MPDWQSLVARPDLDVIWIGAHPNLHEPVTLAALANNKHVFCQARMARNLAEARRMLAASDAKPGLVTMLCPPPFGLRDDAFVRRLLGGKAVGNPTRIHLRSLNGAFLDCDAPAHWRQRREISGCNVMTLGIHVEILQRWFGDIRSVKASGEIRTPVRHGYTVTVPEILGVRARFAAGFDATLDFGTIDTGPPGESLLIEGDSGQLFIDFLTDTLTLRHDGRQEVLPVPPELARPWQVERDFITAVRNPADPRPAPTFRQGVAYMRVVEAVDTARTLGTEQILEVPN